MDRISRIEPEQAEGQVAHLYDAATAMLGRVANSYRTMAHTPHLASMLMTFDASLQRESAGSLLSTKIKEMVVIKTTKINGCNY